MKRAKIAVNNINENHTSGPKVQASASDTTLPKNLIQDLNDTPSPGIEQDVQQIGGKLEPKPEARPLA